MRILLAEDSMTQATMVKMALQRRGYEVILARDGIDAIKKAYQERPNLIVSDVIMPRVNGYQVCRLLKDDRHMAAIPVILLTSLDQKQDMFWGLKSGADKYLTKGGDIPGLAGEISAFFEEWQKGVEEKGAAAKLAEAKAIAGNFDFDVMERIIHLLDKNLFESTVINEIQNLVNILDDYRKTIVSVLEILGKVIDFHVGCIFLDAEEEQEFYYYVNKSVDRSFISHLRDRVIKEMPPITEAASISDETRVEIFDPLELLKQPGSHPEKPQSASFIKLYTSGQQSGVIALASAEEEAFSERTWQTFEIIARQANIVVDYARLYEKNKQLSITDGLTKLYNHRYFQDNLKREFARSIRRKSPLALIMMDIDHFKRFNDTYGHQQGDMVLQNLARVLKGQIRSLDVVARYGGEEFAIIMPDAGEAECLKVAERLRKAVEQYPVPSKDGPLQVTVSLGIATIPHSEIGTPTKLINAADRALYRAKEKGRNRVEI